MRGRPRAPRAIESLGLRLRVFPARRFRLWPSGTRLMIQVVDLFHVIACRESTVSPREPRLPMSVRLNIPGMDRPARGRARRRSWPRSSRRRPPLLQHPSPLMRLRRPVWVLTFFVPRIVERLPLSPRLCRHGTPGWCSGLRRRWWGRRWLLRDWRGGGKGSRRPRAWRRARRRSCHRRWFGGGNTVTSLHEHIFIRTSGKVVQRPRVRPRGLHRLDLRSKIISRRDRHGDDLFFGFSILRGTRGELLNYLGSREVSLARGPRRGRFFWFRIERKWARFGSTSSE